MSNLVTANYQDLVVTFTDDGWFNATVVADRYGKRPVDWARLDETTAYLAALSEALGISEPKSLIRAKRNSGTWLHPKLAVRFAQWLDMRFAVWCDLQIDALLRGAHPHNDWHRMRHEAAASCKVMNQIIQMTRQSDGKEVAPYHYSNEAKLVNWALSGKFQGLDRNKLPVEDLDHLAKLEERNAVLIGGRMGYEDRKQALNAYAAELRKTHAPKLPGPQAA
jgi:hypothetical protein